jgi:hypothetical protein
MILRQGRKMCYMLVIQEFLLKEPSRDVPT